MFLVKCVFVVLIIGLVSLTMSAQTQAPNIYQQIVEPLNQEIFQLKLVVLQLQGQLEQANKKIADLEKENQALKSPKPEPAK